MTENIKVFNLDGNFIGVQDRATFYKEIKDEFKRTGKITRKIESIRILLLNSKGRIYLQKRSSTKKENANLYDKTIGGHISNSETKSVTVIKECAEELGFPAVVLSEEEFNDSISSLDLSVVGVLKQVSESQNFLSVRKTEDGDFLQPFITYFYIGYYDGSITFKDGESSGLETFSIEELLKELKKNPEKFTDDLKYMVENYKEYLIPLKKD
ncbi:MAG: NUDIX hydrolase [Candidatus Nomurabacteria bacterium GW2011_GWF2_43_8]|uniref:NUDIX hydrolase n=3 Tax=Candidatus Nomuraibacteriota TaxID=1752729 RepID=A0A0G1HUJ6_9BACT|nr:MAG: NUDIX hydrolase [Candidatus Nomurabacteria bacterium GW2011_GWA2_43_15]KKT20130.1 MAG: NUDIX hydrolase [Candidatus Nomurabacteria bacterium GW2011_GWB1_43_7]KKT23252.1 MAG: NUDIX hydrolase [Candidatus Nomurabacteria bacterium GW2011_GWF2_43_8]